MSTSSFQIQVDNSHPTPVYYLSGIIDENAELSPLLQAGGAELVLDMHDIRRINSYGVRAWTEIMRQLPSHMRIYFTRCSPPVVDQCNMVVGFRSRAEIVSFYAPLICEDCDEQRTLLFDTAQCLTLGGSLPPVPCPTCGQLMEIDDLEEHYLFFLHSKLEQAPG